MVLQSGQSYDYGYLQGLMKLLLCWKLRKMIREMLQKLKQSLWVLEAFILKGKGVLIIGGNISFNFVQLG